MARKGQTEAAAVRRLKSLDLRIEGKSYRTIAALLDVDPKTAWNDVQQSLTDLNIQRIDRADRLQRELTEQIDYMLEEAMRQVGIDHVMVNHGKVVDGVVDEGAKLHAIATALKLLERKAKLLGLDAPDKQETQGTQEIIVRYADDTPQDEKTE